MQNIKSSFKEKEVSGFKNEKSEFSEQTDIFNLPREAVTACFREPFIIKGYRKPNMNPLDCVKSAFVPYCNETVNIWTHGVPLLLFLFKFVDLFSNSLPLADPMNWPLFSNAVGICGFCLMSTVAHMFNCLSPTVRNSCFFFDYAAIGIYSVGAGQTVYFYCRPMKPELYVLKSPIYWGLFSLFISVTSTALCCSTRIEMKWHRYKYLIRTGAFSIPLIVNTSPYLYRLVNNSSPEDNVQSSCSIITMHYIFYIIAGVANVSRFPERYIPGVFDCCGQSHNFLHICTALGALYQFNGVLVESQTRKNILAGGDVQVSFWNTIFFMVLAVISNFVLVLRYSELARKKKYKLK